MINTFESPCSHFGSFYALFMKIVLYIHCITGAHFTNTDNSNHDMAKKLHQWIQVGCILLSMHSHDGLVIEVITSMLLNPIVLHCFARTSFFPNRNTSLATLCQLFIVWKLILQSPKLIEAEWRIYVSWNLPSLVQMMACCLAGAKPLSEPMMEYCWLGPWEQTSVKS